MRQPGRTLRSGYFLDFVPAVDRPRDAPRGRRTGCQPVRQVTAYGA